MSEFLPISSCTDCVTRVDALRIPSPIDRAVPSSTPTAAKPSDVVELSDRARFLSQLKDMPEIRADLVQRVRADIAAGAYDKPGVIDATIDAAISDIDLFA